MTADDLMQLGRECMAPLNPPHHNGVRIITHNIYPPIPIRNFDWSAVLDSYDEGDAVGYGATEAEAIADLREQLEESE